MPSERIGPWKKICMALKINDAATRIRTYYTISFTVTSSVKHLAIQSLQNNTTKLMIIARPKVILVISQKKRLAKSTLLLPMQFPIMPQVASWIPIGTIYNTVAMEAMTTQAACSDTPRVPEITTITQRPHISAHIKVAAGIPTLRYSPQPQKEVRSGQLRAGLIAAEQFPQIITVTRMITSLLELATPRPMSPRSKYLTYMKQNGTCSAVPTNIATMGTNVILWQANHRL